MMKPKRAIRCPDFGSNRCGWHIEQHALHSHFKPVVGDEVMALRLQRTGG